MKKWQVKTPDENAAARLMEETGLNPFICKILVSRNICSRQQAEMFFNSEELSDPFLMADMEKAVETINGFIENGEKITVYGDYDCDGITSTYMLFNYLEATGAEVDWYIPTRDEGYGLNNAAIDLLHKRGTRLIITVDNGVSAVSEAEHIAELGMTLVITDHHQVPEVLPNAAAIVNPHRKEDMSVFRKIAGCGVALKLIAAMEGDGETALEEYAAFAAVGTIADIVPLVDENRLIVRRGLEQAMNSDNEGLRSLIRQSGITEEKDMTASRLAFTVCPRINAAGRCADPKVAMEALLAENPNTAKAKAEELSLLNNTRKEMVEEIVAAAEEQIRKDPSLLNRKVLIVSGEGWNHGVIGIASTRLLHKYGKPNIVITVEGETARGSARSVEELPLYTMLESCKDLLLRFGGHTKAAGLTLNTADIDIFRNRLYSYCDNMPAAVETITADMKITSDMLTEENIRLLDKLEPFGEENPLPLFLFENCIIRSKTALKDGKYVSFSFSMDNRELRGIDFGMSFAEFPYTPGDRVDIMARAVINEFNGRRSIDIHVEDIRYSGFNQDRFFAAKSAYEDYRCGRVDKRLLCRMAPEQAELKTCYDILRKTPLLSRAAMNAFMQGINYCKFRIMLDIFSEFGLITQDMTTDSVQIIQGAPKADLSKSKILADLKSM